MRLRLNNGGGKDNEGTLGILFSRAAVALAVLGGLSWLWSDIPDSLRDPWFWSYLGLIVLGYDHAGHFYTVYYLSLAAGFPPRTAFRNAFFAQLPDEISELDATIEGANALLKMLRLYMKMRTWLVVTPQALAAMIEYNLTAVRTTPIQDYYHALTGNPAMDEEWITREALLHPKVEPGTAVFGGLSHRYGDCYAHQVMEVMQDGKLKDQPMLLKRDYDQLTGASVAIDKTYDGPLGHAKGTALVYQPELGEKVLQMGSVSPWDPEYIHKRKALYKQYCRELYSIYTKRSGRSLYTTSQIEDFAQEIADQGQDLGLPDSVKGNDRREELQIYRISSEITTFLGRMQSVWGGEEWERPPYEPELVGRRGFELDASPGIPTWHLNWNTMPFDDFRRRYGEFYSAGKKYNFEVPADLVSMVIDMRNALYHPPPIAAFSFSPPEPRPGDTITLDASKSRRPGGRIIDYQWTIVDQFGNKSYLLSNTPVIPFTPENLGTYDVTLVVKGDDGQRDQLSKQLSVVVKLP